MKFSNVRLLVRNYAACFKFYKDRLGLEPAWGDEHSGYASFKVAQGIEGFALFESDAMAEVIGGSELPMPTGCRDKAMIVFEVGNVDEVYESLSANGIGFLDKPTDRPAWGLRIVHLRDPEGNVIELFAPLASDTSKP